MASCHCARCSDTPMMREEIRGWLAVGCETIREPASGAGEERTGRNAGAT